MTAETAASMGITGVGQLIPEPPIYEFEVEGDERIESTRNRQTEGSSDADR